MRHEKKISKVMESFYEQKDSLEEALDILRPIKSMLEDAYEDSLKVDNDKRSGEETYGYKDEESILSNLWYISDRWGASFRIRWMLDLIERN